MLAGGGERAVAWERGVLAGLADLGLEPARAERIVGTSAGALVATALALGEAPAEPDGPGPPPPAAAEGLGALSVEWAEAAAQGGREGRRAVGALALAADTAPASEFVAETERRLPPRAATGPWPAALVIAAVDAVTGERVAYSEDDGLPLGLVVAASRAVPGVRAPVEIRGHPNVDGAVSSATNADLAAGAEHVRDRRPRRRRSPRRAACSRSGRPPSRRRSSTCARAAPSWRRSARRRRTSRRWARTR